MTLISQDAVNLIKEYARENMRMATDTIRHDPLLRGEEMTPEKFDKTVNLMDEGLMAATRYHAAKDILSLLGIGTDDL